MRGTDRWRQLLALALALGACSPVASGPVPASGAPVTAATTQTRTAAATQTAASLPADGLGTRPIGATERATVVRVVDGDTIVVDRGHGNEKVRYIGVDTPETVKSGTPVQWMGPEASAANKRLVEGREVVLERDVSETDRFGRLLRYVWLEDPSRPSGWTFVNLELVAEGFAQMSTFPPDVRYVDAYLTAQRAAREAGLGLWGADPRATSPGTGAGSPTACDPSYPSVCIPPSPPDLDCADIEFRRFTVLPPDPHRFDLDFNGVGCEA